MSEESLPQNFSRHPLAWLAAYFTLGVTCRHFIETGLVVPFAVAIFLATLAAVLPRVSKFLLPLSFVLLGMIALQSEISSISENRVRRIYDEGRIASHEPVAVEGVVIGSLELANDGIFILVAAEKLRFKSEESSVTGRIRLFVPLSDSQAADGFQELDVHAGSKIRAFCRLDREEEFQNPGVPSRVSMLDSQGIDAKATLKSPLLIENVGGLPTWTPGDWIYRRRHALIGDFQRSFSPQTAGVLIASLLGDKHFLDGRTADVFRDGGTFHVLVISGLHITFIGGLAVWIVSLFSRRRSLQFTIAAIFLWAYTIAVGADVPVVRASLMFTVLLFSHIFERHGSQLNAFGACVLMLLVWRPSDLFTPSFQLTVVSVCSIVACAFPIVEKLRAIGRWMPTSEEPFPPNVPDKLRRFCELLYWNETVWKMENSRRIWSANLFKRSGLRFWMATNVQTLTAYLFEGAIVSLIVQIWMLPVVIIYFHRVSAASILLNLWVGFFLAAESFAGVFAVLVSKASYWLAAPLVELTEFFNAAMMSVPAWLSDLGYAGFRLPAYSGVGRCVYILYGIAVALAARRVLAWRPFDLRNGTWRLSITVAPVAVMMLGMIIILHPLSAPGPDGKLRIHFLDVGQGDSALVVFPDGETMLIDGGGKPDLRAADDGSGFFPDTPRIGEAVVSEFLWEQGYSRIDYLVATHADADHMQGLSDVAKNFHINEVLVGSTPSGDPEYDDLMRVAAQHQIPVKATHRGDKFSIAGVTLNILNPRTNADSGSANNSSVVLKIEYGLKSFLMTGDIEKGSEQNLVDGGCEGLDVDVVKVPHHGSRTSSTDAFVKCTQPLISIISVGRRSRFGHPHAEVVERWLSAGAKVFRTGEKGTITIETDGDSLETRTFLP
ncbi:MAG: hypothetical protein DMF63_07825 [Acidobacteria bacterium]|nr:MAG: hypothetical protein DMF63_07825 [Acidobacteriota bacterium]